MKKRPLTLLGLLLFLSSYLSSCSLWSVKLPEDDILVSYGAPQAERLNNEFSILVWNIYKGQKSQWQSAFHKLKDGHDLHVFQEGMCCDVGDDSGRHQVFAKSFTYTDTGKSTGVVTSSKVAASYTKFMRSKGREFFVATPKMALITKYPTVGGQELLVANIHSLNFVSNEAWQEQLNELVQELRDHSGPLILAGDFNTWNEDRMALLLRTADKLGLTSVEFKTSDKRVRFLGLPLDHVFYRNVELKAAKVVDNDGSDHEAMSLRFALSAPLQISEAI